MTGLLEYNFIVKQLVKETNNQSVTYDEDIAALLMEVAPTIMRHIRNEMRSRRMRGLSIPQFRTLVFLSRYEGACLLQVADHIGVTSATASKIIDALAERRLVLRVALRDDRRYVSLRLSKPGVAMLVRARKGTEAFLAEKLATLPPEQQTTVSTALLTLLERFTDRQVSFGKKGVNGCL